jgi:hypothetical protein
LIVFFILTTEIGELIFLFTGQLPGFLPQNFIFLNRSHLVQSFWSFFGPVTMRDVYLNFRLPRPAKITTGMLTRKIVAIIYLTTWTALIFDHTDLGFSGRYLNQILFLIFWKKKLIIFSKNSKNMKFCSKNLLFSRFFSQKSRKSSEFLKKKIIILDSWFTNKFKLYRQCLD